MVAVVVFLVGRGANGVREGEQKGIRRYRQTKGVRDVGRSGRGGGLGWVN